MSVDSICMENEEVAYSPNPNKWGGNADNTHALIFVCHMCIQCHTMGEDVLVQEKKSTVRWCMSAQADQRLLAYPAHQLGCELFVNSRGRGHGEVASWVLQHSPDNPLVSQGIWWKVMVILDQRDQAHRKPSVKALLPLLHGHQDLEMEAKSLRGDSHKAACGGGDRK